MKPIYTALLRCLLTTMTRKKYFALRCGISHFKMNQLVCYGKCNLGAGVECAMTSRSQERSPRTFLFIDKEAVIDSIEYFSSSWLGRKSDDVFW